MKIFYKLFFLIMLGLLGCTDDEVAMSNTKNNSLDPNSSNPMVSYTETQLKQDYAYAFKLHNELLPITLTNTSEHAIHHNGQTSSIPNNVDTLYNMKMFNEYDSLFSAHLFTYCVEMMKNSQMMSSSSNMMGGSDMSQMSSYMDSLHTSIKNAYYPDYFKIDSVMYNKITECKTTHSVSNAFKDVFNQMQTLRIEHKNAHKF